MGTKSRTTVGPSARRPAPLVRTLPPHRHSRRTVRPVGDDARAWRVRWRARRDCRRFAPAGLRRWWRRWAGAPRALRGCRHWPRAARRRCLSVQTGARGTRLGSRRSERARRQHWRAGWAAAWGLGGEVGVCRRRLCGVGGRCGRVRSRLGGGVGVGHGLFVGTGSRAWVVRGGLCDCVSVCKT